MNPEQLKASMDFYRTNPQDKRAAEFTKRLKSGAYDTSLNELGLARTPNGIFAKTKPDEKTGLFPQFRTNVENIYKDTKEKIKEKQTGGAEVGLKEGYDLSRGLQTVGAVAEGIMQGAGEAVKAVVPDVIEKPVGEAFSEGLSSLAEAPIIGGALGRATGLDQTSVSKLLSDFATKHPKASEDLNALFNIASVVPVGAVGSMAGKTATTAAKNVASSAAKGIVKTTDNIASAVAPATEAASGVAQFAKEKLTNIPRAAQRVNETIAEASVKSQAIKNAPNPAVAKAIEIDLPEPILKSVTAADSQTLEKFKEVINSIDKRTDGVQENPTIVGGRLLEDQYDIINKKRKSVGELLGEEVKSLDNNKVSIFPYRVKLDNVLTNNGINIKETANGIQLDFSGSPFTKAQRAKIKELYQIASEGGDDVAPRTIYNKDRLFSQAQREAKMAEIGDIIVDTGDGNSASLFSVFRDVYSSALDDVSPRIKELNSEYRKYRVLQDTVEDTLLKGGAKYKSINVDPAEFAKVNMRRIFGESQSSPLFEKIADVLDAEARGLGYNGAKPKDVAEFAQSIREIFPEIVPPTSFAGALQSGGISGAVGKALEIGKVTAKDRQKVLRDLLDYYATS